MNEIQNVFEPENEQQSVEDDVKNLISVFPDKQLFTIFTEEIDMNTSGIIFYISGYCVKAILRLNKCESCKNLISLGKKLDMKLEEDSVGLETTRMEFLHLVDRGGLQQPSDLIYITCLHAYQLQSVIVANEELKKSLLNSSFPRQTFACLFDLLLSSNDNTAMIETIQCKSGHSFSSSIPKLARVMFNIFSKNLISEVNDKIHSGKKRGSNKSVSNENKETVFRIR